jgi:hypothetical protein
MIKNKYDDRSHDGDKHAINIEPGYTAGAERRENESSNERPDDTKDYIEKKSFPCLVDDFAADESGDQSEDDPT